MDDSPKRAAWTWASVPRPVRQLARWVTIAQAAGYGVGLALVRQALNLPGSEASGTDGPSVAEPLTQMLLSTHSHLLGMTALFTISGIAFSLCERPGDPWKQRILIAPFVAIVTAFTAVWLMKYWHGPFSWVLVAANVAMAVAFYTQIIVVLRELRRVRTAGG